MDRHAATRRLRHLAEAAGIQIARAHPHMLRHTYVTTMLDAGADLRDVQIAARHADPRTTMRYVEHAAAWTGTPLTLWLPTSRVPPGNPHWPAPTPPGGYSRQADRQWPPRVRFAKRLRCVILM
jgi:hypothetical protein